MENCYTQRQPRYVRLFVSEEDVSLKLEMINDVPAHVGAITTHPVLSGLGEQLILLD